MFSFGSGVLVGTPNGANITPINFGLIQSCDLDISQTVKELYGQYDVPVAIASGQKKLTGKAKMARISGRAFASLFFGVEIGAGQTMTQFGEAASVPASSPYSYQTTNHTTFVADQGVIYAATGLPLVEVASGPTTGQYSQASGTYTFAAADEGKAVLISYTYTVAGTGQSFTASQKLIGSTVNFSANLFSEDPTTGNQFSAWLYNCVASKLSFGTKLEDFTMPELDFSFFANAAGQYLTLNFGDAA